MKSSQITQRTLIESYIRSNDATTAHYMRIMNENFVIPFNKSLMLNEVALDAQTINQIFAQAEQGMTGLGANRTALGKGTDVAGALGGAAAAGAKAVGGAAATGAKAVGQGAAAAGKGAVDLAKKGAAGVKDLANKLLAQHKAKFEKSLPPVDAGPVENFEQQAAQAAEQIQDPKAKQSVMDLIKQATKNPAVQTMVLAAVGGIATIVAGPAIAGLGLGMAATGALTGSVVGGLTGVVRGAMQGQGLKGALKQGAMGAGIGALGGGVAGAVAQGAQSYMQNKNQQQLPAADQAQNDAADAKAASEWAAAEPAQRAEIEKVTGMTPQQMQTKIPANPVSATSTALPDGTPIERTTGNSSPEYMNQFGGDQPNQGTATTAAPSNEPAAPVANQGRLNLNKWRQETGSPNAVNESIDRRQTARRWALQESLGREQSGYVLTPEAIDAILEGKIGDWFKKVGSNLTNKVTADKLKSAWTKANMPNDSEAIAGILTQAGVGQVVVHDVFKKLGIPTSGQAGAQQAQDQTAQGQTASQQAASAQQAAQSANRTSQQTTSQSQAEPTTGLGDKAADALNGAAAAWDRGVGMGATGQSVADQSYGKETGKPASTVKVKDAQGQEHSYKKVGQQWFDKDNKPVDSAQASMLDQQATQQAAPGKKPTAAQQPAAATTQEPFKLAGQTLDPADPASAKIIAQIQKQQGERDPAATPAQEPAAPTPTQEPAAAQSPEEVRKAKQASAAQTAQAQMASNPAQAQQDKIDPAFAQRRYRVMQLEKGIDPDTNEQIPADQIPVRMKAEHEKNKAAEQQPAAVWKNNRAPEGTPAGTSPADAAAKVNTGNDVMARIAKQLAPAPTAAPNFGQQQTGYSSVKMNAPTGTPKQPAIQPTAGAKAVPTQPAAPAATPAPAAQPAGFGSRGIAGMDSNAPAPAAAPAKPGFLQTATDKIAAKAKQPEMASIDFSAALLRKMKTKL